MIKDIITLQFPDRTETAQDKALVTEYPFGQAKVSSHNQWSRKTASGFRLHAATAEGASSVGWVLPDPKAFAKLQFFAQLAVTDSCPVRLKVEVKRNKRVTVSQDFHIGSMEPARISVGIPRYKSSMEITVHAVSLQMEPKPKYAVVDLSGPVLQTVGKPGRY
ncbi:MAG TPA: hypothetical protein VNZ61_18870 [Roseomonas sp.]|nr:hypothetical protein [Roseomonas sp.]